MKTLVAIPCYDKVTPGFAWSLLNLQKEGEVDFDFEVGSLIYFARNKLSIHAMTGGYDFMLFIDSDMEFEPDLLKRLLQTQRDTGADLVTGLFFMRRGAFNPSIFKAFRYEKVGENALKPVADVMMDYPRDSVFPIAGCGMAATLISVPALREIVEKEGEPFSPGKGFGEDFSFCIRMASHGKKMVCDSRIKVAHAAQILITESLFLSQEAARNGN